MHVFVSHSSADAAIANEYAAALESNGLTAWIAPRDLRPGTDYAQTISQAIRDASTFLLLCSDTSLASPDVRNEFELAKRRSTPVIPIRLPGASDPLDNAAWEYHLLRLQIVNGDDPTGTITRILSSLKVPTETAVAAPPVGTASSQPLESGGVTRTPESEKRLTEVWDRATRTISKVFENEKLLPRQKLEDGGGLRWVYLDQQDGPYAAVEFVPSNLGGQSSPLWFAVHHKTPEFQAIRAALMGSPFADQVKQTHDGIRVPLEYKLNSSMQDAVDAVVETVVELRNVGVP